MKNSNSEHHIGQTLYMISSKELRIIPIIVSEQVMTRTLGGTTVSWAAILGPEGSRKTLDLNEIKGQKFTKLEDAKRVLMQNFERMVDKAVESARDNREKWYRNDLPEFRNALESHTSVEEEFMGEFDDTEEYSAPVEPTEEERQRALAELRKELVDDGSDHSEPIQEAATGSNSTSSEEGNNDLEASGKKSKEKSKKKE